MIQRPTTWPPIGAPAFHLAEIVDRPVGPAHTTNMTRHQRLATIATLIACLSVDACAPDELARQELMSFRATLTRDSTRDAIQKQAGNFSKLSLSRVSDANWVVRTPLVFSARNWVLHLAFDEQGRLVSGRVRIFDSETMMPEGAPPDLSFP